MVQRRSAGAHGGARLGPDLGFDAAAADGAGRLAIGEEKHFGAATLRRRTARVRDCGHHHAFTTRAGLVNHSIEIALSNSSHNSVPLTVSCNSSNSNC